MEYQHSKIVDPSMYETDGLCDGIPLRIHKNTIDEEIGAIRAQEDWKKLVGPLEHYKGGCSAKFSLVQISVPECIPERVEICAYADEVAFLHDDALDYVNQDQSNAENDQMLNAFIEGIQTGSIKSEKSGKSQIQSKIFRDMMAIDQECAMTAIKSWAAFLQLASGRSHDKEFVTFDEYLSYRILDVGEMFWFGLLTFGMALKIPAEEMGVCRQLTRSAYIASALQNDIFSLEKELEISSRQGQKNVVNAVWLLMREHSIPVDEARELCKVKVREYVAEFLRIVQDSKNMDISLDLRKYLEAMLYTLSGNVVWSKICPRYNPKGSFSHLQLSMMNNGVDNTLKRYGLTGSAREKARQYDQAKL